MNKYIKFLCITFVFQGFVFAQNSDFDNQEFLFDVKSLDLRDYDYEMSRLKGTLNYGVHVESINYRKRGYIIPWNAKDQHLGFINKSLLDEPISIQPVIIGEIKSKKKSFFKAQSTDIEKIVTPIINELIAYLSFNLNFKEVHADYQLKKVDIKNIRENIYLNLPIDHLNKVLKIKYNSLPQFLDIEHSRLESNLFIPSFLLVTNKHESYLHVDLQLLKNNSLILRTSTNIFLDSNLNEIEGNDILNKSIVESLFHQINLK